ncbi:MAG: WHG domain-containing protein [Herpetosiphonaceae bacterium]|nr:WHG domain-containing protein [Herpetosiphonaceae bacterium]
MARSVGIDRTKVIAVAAELADEFGLEQLTLAQVATRLGVKLPSLYNHVDGLPDLRRALALLGIRQLMVQFTQAAIGKAEDAAIIAMADAYRAYARAHPGLYAATLRAPGPDDVEALQAAQSIVEVVLTVLEPYGLAEAAAIHAVRGLRSIIHGFVTLELAGGFELPLDHDESFRWLLHTYSAGVRAAAPSG